MATVLPQLNIIPNLPTIHQEVVQLTEHPNGDKTYHMHPEWHHFFSQLTTALQSNFSQEGFIVPNQSTNNINLLTAKNNTLIVDNLLNVPKIILNGVVKTFTVT